MDFMKVPFVDLKAQSSLIGVEVNEAIQKVIESTAFILGPDVKRFEEHFAAFCETDYAIGVDSGTSAIELILRAFEIGPGDEVIAPANTFVATVLPITYVGATPVLVEMDPKTYNIDVNRIEEKITPKTRAIMPVHLYGQPVDMDPIVSIAKKHNLLVIEDACQAHGAYYKGKRAGSMSDAAAFSFYPAKNLGCYGDGGMAITPHAAINEKIRKLRDYGQEKKYHHVELGYNRRLDTIQAAVLDVKLKYLDQWNDGRRAAAGRYLKQLSGSRYILPEVLADVTPVWHLFVIQTDRRDELQKYLGERGISTGIHYPIPIHLQKSYQHLGYAEGDFPLTEKADGRMLSLPMYAELTEEMTDHVVNSLLSFS